VSMEERRRTMRERRGERREELSKMLLGRDSMISLESIDQGAERIGRNLG